MQPSFRKAGPRTGWQAVVPKQQFITIVVVDRPHVADPAVPRNSGAGSAFYNSYEFEVRRHGRAPDYRSSLLDDVVIAWRIVRRGVSMANCQIGLSAVVFEVLIPLPECATSLSYSFV
jgi:hypothetical protein